MPQQNIGTHLCSSTKVGQGRASNSQIVLRQHTKSYLEYLNDGSSMFHSFTATFTQIQEVKNGQFGAWASSVVGCGYWRVLSHEHLPVGHTHEDVGEIAKLFFVMTCERGTC